MNGDYPLYAVNVELTLACNMNCVHCGSEAGKSRKDELRDGEFLRFFTGLAELGCEEVCLLGGEPFLHPSWEPLASEVVRLGMRLVMISNGFVVDGALVEKLKKLPHLDRIGISLDGGSPEVHDRIRRREGAFERAVDALFLLRDAGIETGAITTVSRINVGELDKIKGILMGEDITWQIQTASYHGGRLSRDEILSESQFYDVGAFISSCRNAYPVDELPVAGSHDIGYFSSYLTKYSELPEWKGCGAGLYTLGLTSNGSVKGCLALSDRFIEDSVRRRDIREIWRDDSLFARNRRFSVDLLEGFCAGCRHRAVCRGGCIDQGHSLTGSLYNNPYCFHRLEEEGIVKPPGVEAGGGEGVER